MNAAQYKKMIESIVVPAVLPKEKREQCYQPLINFLEKQTPKRLYHFRRCDARSLEALDTGRLYFSPPSQMNDNFDSMLYFSKEQIKREFKRFIENVDITQVLRNAKQSGQLPLEITQRLPAEAQALLLKRINIDPLNNISDRLNQTLEIFLQNIDAAKNEIQGCVQNSVRVACFSTAIPLTR